MGISIEQWRISIGSRTFKMSTESLQSSASSRWSPLPSTRIKYLIIVSLVSISLAIASALCSTKTIEASDSPAPWQVLMKSAHLQMWLLPTQYNPVVLCSFIPVSKISQHLLRPSCSTSKCTPWLLSPRSRQGLPGSIRTNSPTTGSDSLQYKEVSARVKNILQWPGRNPKYDHQQFLHSLFSMITNFQCKYTYGNRKARGIKIAHWNKGNSFLINKMTEVRSIVEQHHPHILGLSEANLLASQDKSLVQLEDYKMHICQTINNSSLATSRIVVYTHKELVVKLRSDLMCDTISSVWLEVGLPGQKRFLVCQTYREWQLVRQDGDMPSSTIPQQLSRWLLFLDQWERALATSMEVHCLGDMNLNHCNWTDSNLPCTNQSYKLRELITALFTRILPHGVTQLVSGPTRHFPGQVSTGLDHFYSNRPEKISNIQKHYWGGSDHMLITGIRHSKAVKNCPKYIRKRCYKHFDKNLFVDKVSQLSWLEVYLSEDVDEAVHLLSKNLTNVLDEMAPLRTIQIRKNYNPFISKETKELMKARDKLQQLASKN